MGHGEKLILADANFPANTSNDKVIRLDGVGIKEAASAILSVFPLDSFINSKGGSPALRMEVDDKPDELTETHKEFIDVVKKVSGENWNVGQFQDKNFMKRQKKLIV